MDKEIKHALEELENVRVGDIFVVRDLWVGHLWNRISISNRLLIGRLFYNTITQQNHCSVEILEKTKDKQQKYRKKQ